MSVALSLFALLATVNKHHLAGIVAIVVGALGVIVGAVRALRQEEAGGLILVAGVVIIVLGILLYVRKI